MATRYGTRRPSSRRAQRRRAATASRSSGCSRRRWRRSRPRADGRPTPPDGVVRSIVVDSAAIVVLGGSEAERARLVEQLAASGVAASGDSHLPMTSGLPAMLIMVGSEAAQLVAEA